jgi:hypothetical protein
VFRWDGFRVYFYSRENSEPPHVHIDKGSATAKVWLDPVALSASSGFSPRELANVLQLARANRQMFLEAWHGFFYPGTSG